MNTSELNQTKKLIIKYGVDFDQNCDRFLPLVKPLLTKTGKIKVHQPHIGKRPKNWWQAQCAFRGLRVSGNLSELQDRIRSRNKHKDDDLAREHEACREVMAEDNKRRLEQSRSISTHVNGSLSENECSGSDRLVRPRRTKQTARKSVRPWPPILFHYAKDEDAGSDSTSGGSDENESESDENESKRDKDESERDEDDQTRKMYGHTTTRPPRTKQTARKSVRPWPPVLFHYTKDEDAGSDGRSGGSDENESERDEDESERDEDDQTGKMHGHTTTRPPRTKQTARKRVRPWRPVPFRYVEDENAGGIDESGSDENESESDEDEQMYSSTTTSRGTTSGARTSQTARKSTPSHPIAPPHRISKTIKGVDWDITGDWDIDCEELSNYLPGPYAEITMDISHDTCKPGAYMAIFDFNIIEGIMRISCPKPKKNEREVRGTYVYRGRETGEGEIQLGHDVEGYSIKFSDRGSRLEGEFSGAGCGHVSFTGVKVARGAQRSASSWSEWNSFSEEAYELARVRRWR